ncbi:HipA family kinase [Ornithinimicrobium faecis]|uniref:Aminotransferase class I and II n=1 Tax=Ornithinimicrobium faecis TaxID=2934158 RepID=A0ABY4YQ15_9MICO|nr:MULTISPECIES: HipA family kinase [unclassified Ornithinimicrobium]USQ78237.1 aminotransferase class I and II [Ornithinimicrobium sp. HY1793]
MLDHVTAVRYVTPLREGGSMPGVVEADDLGTYVVKFRGAGQGVKVLVTEVIVGELARRLDLPVPRMVTIDLPPAIARYEADEEVQDLLNASPGTNLGMDLLPGSLGYDGSRPPSPELAARIVWLDAFTANVDRTWSNPNLLTWHRETWLIDHGAALYFHHSWPSKEPNPQRFAQQPFRADDHVLGGVATDLPGVHAELSARITPELIGDVLDQVPEDWLETTTHLTDTQAVRSAYRDHLLARVQNPAAWLPGGGA